MKRFLAALALSLACIVSFGATTTPVQLLNPAGSTAGQAIISNGPTSAPAWGAITATSYSGTLPIVNGGTGATTAVGAQAALGLGTAATANTGTSGATVPLLNGVNTWAAAQTFSIRPTFNGATPYDSANLTIANYAPLASPTFTGTPAAPTATAGTNTTQLATTAFVTSAVSTAIPTGWTSYTPTITAASGTFTSASATGAYYKIGNLVFVRVKITITTVGTGTNPIFSLPFTANSSGDRVILAGTETALTGKMLQARVDQSATTSTVYYYDSTAPSANGAVCVISGVYISN